MRKLLSSLLGLIILSIELNAQINPQKIDIIRDAYGVPHIYASTDAEVAYGLAWAHSEDDFKTIQGTLAAGKIMAGQVYGKEGAGIDFFTQFIGAPELVKSQKGTLSAAFRQLLDGYIQGINAYAKAYPEEVLSDDIFPVTEDDLLTAFVLSLSAMSGADQVLGDLVGDKEMENPYEGIGSNGIAISSKLSASNESFLAVNSHQPFEGPASWYEVHLNSEEGWNMLGSLFPASPTIFHGVNENLGWAHTVNHPDKIDVYQLKMHPKKKDHYIFDNEVIPLEVRKAKLKVKMLGIKLPLRKKFYISKYGPVIKNKHGYYAISFAANRSLKAIQQWYEMTKASNFSEFKAAISGVHLPGFNMVYADREHIYYISNAKLPKRNPDYDWSKTLPGDTSATLWQNYHSFEELPQYTDPDAGYLFNMNNTPFNATANAENLKASDFPKEMGFSLSDNNRSVRFQQLMKGYDQLTYMDFKKIKFDIQYPDELKFEGNLNYFFGLNPADYPTIKEYLEILQNWDRRANQESVGAGLMKVLLNNIESRQYSEAEAVALIEKCQEELMENFGTIQVKLSELQVHKRGAIEMPIDGLPDVIAPIYTEKIEGEELKQKAYVGESYILLARFGEGLPKLESVIPYGASSKPDSPHYTDQMELFAKKELKPMTLAKDKVYEEAQRIYHPEK